MEINIRRERKIVDIWLTREEQQDTALSEKMKLLYQNYSKMGYMTVVFESGEQDLWVMTSDLLCNNCKRSAQMEVGHEAQKGMSLGV